MELIRRDFVMKKCPTAFCHASTILPLTDGSLLCCWFGGTREGARDTAIYGARRTAEGWSLAEMIAGGSTAHWNPVLHAASAGKVKLFYKLGQKIAFWRTYVRESLDGGITWGAAQELVPGDRSGGRGPVRTKLLQLADGRLVAGTSSERGKWLAYADVSSDAGVTWQRSEPIAIAGADYEPRANTLEKLAQLAGRIAVSVQSFCGRGVIQPSVWEDEKGLHMLLRSSEGRVYRSDALDDSGSKWSGAYPLNVPNNNSGLDVVRVGKRLYLVCNPVAKNWGARSPLTLFTSPDGLYWERLQDLETGAGEFSYPALLAVGERLIVSYTYNRSNIRLAELSMELLK